MRWERHRVNQLALIAGLEAMGLKMFVEKPEDRLVTVTAVKIPAGMDDAKVRDQLLDEFNIEIAGGIGATKGQIWRLGTMGYCSQKPFVLQLLARAGQSSDRPGASPLAGAGVGGAIRNYENAAAPAAVAS